jgi:hypothetical protein
VQPATADSYRSITHALTDKRAEFHTFRPKEEKNYRVVLKHMACQPTPTQSNDISDLKALMKSLFEQMGTMINLLTTVLTKLK